MLLLIEVAHLKKRKNALKGMMIKITTKTSNLLSLPLIPVFLASRIRLLKCVYLLFGTTTFSIMTFNITTFSIMSFTITTLSIMTFSRTTFSTMTFSIMDLIVPMSIKDTQHNACYISFKCQVVMLSVAFSHCNAECHYA
jgi:hypothetical protein